MGSAAYFEKREKSRRILRFVGYTALGLFLSTTVLLYDILNGGPCGELITPLVDYALPMMNDPDIGKTVVCRMLGWKKLKYHSTSGVAMQSRTFFSISVSVYEAWIFPRSNTLYLRTKKVARNLPWVASRLGCVLANILSVLCLFLLVSI